MANSFHIDDWSVGLDRHQHDESAIECAFIHSIHGYVKTLLAPSLTRASGPHAICATLTRSSFRRCERVAVGKQCGLTRAVALDGALSATSANADIGKACRRPQEFRGALVEGALLEGAGGGGAGGGLSAPLGASD